MNTDTMQKELDYEIFVILEMDLCSKTIRLMLYETKRIRVLSDLYVQRGKK